MKTNHFAIEFATLKRYALTTSLVAVLICCYQTGMARTISFGKTTGSIINKESAKDSVRGAMLVMNNPMKVANVTIADTLNLVEEHNEDITDSMVSSYLRGVRDANSTYEVKRSARLGTL